MSKLSRWASLMHLIMTFARSNNCSERWDAARVRGMMVAMLFQKKGMRSCGTRAELDIHQLMCSEKERFSAYADADWRIPLLALAIVRRLFSFSSSIRSRWSSGQAISLSLKAFQHRPERRQDSKRAANAPKTRSSASGLFAIHDASTISMCKLSINKSGS